MGVFDVVCGALFALWWGCQLMKDKKAIEEEKRIASVKRWYLANKEAERSNNARDAVPLDQWMIDGGYVRFFWRDKKYIIQTPFGELGGEMRYYI